MRLEAASSERLKGELAEVARALREEQEYPVKLRPIVDRLGLRVEYRHERSLRSEAALLRGPQGWTVAVSRRDLRHPRTRFTIAHEIGHYVLADYGVPTPRTRGDYWRVEALCHYFAGHLLVPEAAVEWVGEGGGGGAPELLHRAFQISRDGWVSPEAVSRRLSQDLACCSFCELGLTSPRRDAVGTVNWISERFDWIGMGRGAYIERSHPLASLLQVHRRVPPDRITEQHVNGFPAAIVRRVGGIWMLGFERALAGGVEGRPGGDQLSLATAEVTSPAAAYEVRAARPRSRSRIARPAAR